MKLYHSISRNRLWYHQYGSIPQCTMHREMIMYCAKGLFGPPSLIYSQCRFAPCFDISLLPPTQITLGACFIHCVNKSASAYLLLACWPLMALESPSPSSLGARFIHCVKKSAFARCRDSMPYSKDHINNKCMVQK